MAIHFVMLIRWGRPRLSRLPAPPPSPPPPGSAAHARCAFARPLVLRSRQGKVRLTKWYSPYNAKEKTRTTREVSGARLSSPSASRCRCLCRRALTGPRARVYATALPPLLQVSAMVLARQQKQCNFLEWHDQKVIYKRYASLYFIMCVDPDDNELIVLETIHHFVEVLDRYFGNVCELDLIFNFHKAYHILDELCMSGELQVRRCDASSAPRSAPRSVPRSVDGGSRPSRPMPPFPFSLRAGAEQKDHLARDGGAGRANGGQR
ncbi:clathrin adaptor complex small chain-domain-containing protein [Pavlovales sp. CCMP2436]|nr:clathrin adaptor complex small chain-domain-containing protein [Pavlovales sp. CCMP2436]